MVIIISSSPISKIVNYHFLSAKRCDCVRCDPKAMEEYIKLRFPNGMVEWDKLEDPISDRSNYFDWIPLLIDPLSCLYVVLFFTEMERKEGCCLIERDSDLPNQLTDEAK